MTMQFDPVVLREVQGQEPPPLTHPRPRLVLPLLGFGMGAVLLAIGWVVFAPRISGLQVVWRQEAPGGVEATPVIAGNMLIVGCMDGSLIAFDRASGDKLYETRGALLGIAGGMVLTESGLIYGSDDNAVTLADPATGEPLAKAVTNGPVRTTPLVLGGTVAVGCDDEHLWELRLPGLESAAPPYWAGSAICGDPLLLNDEIVFVPLQGDVHFLHRKTRALRLAPTPGPVHSSPCAAGGRVWVANDWGRISSVDSSTLEVRVGKSLASPVRSALAASGGGLFVGTNGGFLRVYRGTPLEARWDLPADGPVRARPLIVGDLLIYVADDGCVRVARRSSREVLATKQVGEGRISATPLLDGDGTLYVATADGFVTALTGAALR